MSKDRFNYVATNLDSNPAAHYVTPGGKGEKIAPAVVSQASLGVGTLVVILGAIAATLYVRKEWGVGSMKVRDAIAMHVHIIHMSVSVAGLAAVVLFLICHLPPTGAGR